jgi:hypothetical protein
MGYLPGDYVKVELEGEGELPGEWVWVRVQSHDEKRKIVFGILDNQPISDLKHLKVGQLLAINCDKIRDHRKPTEFSKND